MTEKQIKLLIGSCLQDIGKVVYRSGDGRNHSQSGYEFLKNETIVQNKEILDCVRYHHADHLKGAGISDDSIAYLTYMADNIAASIDRRTAVSASNGFDKNVPLKSVFNILNGNHKDAHYSHQVLDVSKEINYPTTEKKAMNAGFYQDVVRNLKNNLNQMELTEDYAESLLNVLEGNLSYIPSSTSMREQADISLYDHSKMTAAFALCMEAYYEEMHGSQANYRELLFSRDTQAYDEPFFLLYSLDISGIQKFIYTIVSSGALKELRSRSFYLDIVMEHIIDELLAGLSLTRSNVIYSGGGHCYLLLPNTRKALEGIKNHEKLVNEWFMKEFGTALYVAGGYAACSAKDLRNEPVGSYSSLFEAMSRMISEKKAHRYNGDQIRMLNRYHKDGERECKVCKKMAKLSGDDKCPVCSSLNAMSSHILRDDFFVVTKNHEPDALPLPGNSYLIGVDSQEEMLKLMNLDSYVRCYTKNKMYTGKHVTRAIWVGGYAASSNFKELSKEAEGIDRIAVLRADVDNLGQAFVHGFDQAGNNQKYVTLSRTATLSRQLSLFFKCYINQILEKGQEARLGHGGPRNVAIVYSGGDDLFLVGGWNDVIASFIDIRNAFERFTSGALTISGGIGMFNDSFPVNIMARETERLEANSKALAEKNGITLFSEYAFSPEDGETSAYPWPEFLSQVMDGKFTEVKGFFDSSEEHGKAFLYRLLDLLRNKKEPINRARYVYLLSRMEPGKECKKEERERYNQFARNMVTWYQNDSDRKQLVTAIYLYVYLQRQKEEG